MNRKRSNLFRSLILSLKRHLRLFFMCILLACAVMRKTLKDDDDDMDFTGKILEAAAKNKEIQKADGEYSYVPLLAERLRCRSRNWEVGGSIPQHFELSY